MKFCKLVCLFLIPRYKCINSDNGDDNNDNSVGNDDGNDDDDDDDDDLAATPTTL